MVSQGKLAHLACSWLMLVSVGCNCSKLNGSSGDLSFKRCAQVDPPPERTVRALGLGLQVEDRVLTITSQTPELKLAAFTGPVGAALTRAELSVVSEAGADLVIMIGGLGDNEEMASATLAGLVALGLPMVFIAGGADRLDVVKSAFSALDERGRDLMFDATGLREIRFNKDRFAVVPGAPLGRYALDEESCGFVSDDLQDASDALANEKNMRTWLLSWGAPSGFGVTKGLGGSEVGSTELAAFAKGLKVKGGLFAFPESAVGLASSGPSSDGFALVVPRLGRTGATRAEGGRLGSSVARLTLGPAGLAVRP